MRPHGAVTSRALGRGDFVFVEACRRGETLAVSAAAADEADPDFDIVALLPDLMALGAFAL